MCCVSCLVTETKHGVRTIGGLIVDGTIAEGAFLLFEGEDELVKVEHISGFSLLDSKGCGHSCNEVVETVIS